MSSTEFLLGVEELEGVMVVVESEIVVKKVMPLELQGLDYGIKLPFIV